MVFTYYKRYALMVTIAAVFGVSIGQLVSLNSRITIDSDKK